MLFFRLDDGSGFLSIDELKVFFKNEQKVIICFDKILLLFSIENLMRVLALSMQAFKLVAAIDCCHDQRLHGVQLNGRLPIPLLGNFFPICYPHVRLFGGIRYVVHLSHAAIRDGPS